MPKIMISSYTLMCAPPQQAMAFLLKQSDSFACMAVRVDTGEVIAYGVEEKEEDISRSDLVRFLLDEVARQDNPVFWDLFRAKVEKVLREQASAPSSEEAQSSLEL